MARIDDYVNAFKMAAEQLRQRDPLDVSRLSAVEYTGETGKQGLFRFDFIGRPVQVSFPEVLVKFQDAEDEAPLTEGVLILHYLNTADGTPILNDFITFREVPSGEFYYAAFVKRAEAPLVKAFGASPGLLLETAPKIGGRAVPGQGDAAALFLALPQVPVTLVIWGGDDEFEPTGKILFDRSIKHYLSTEDVAWLSGMIVYRLMRLLAGK